MSESNNKKDPRGDADYVNREAALLERYARWKAAFNAVPPQIVRELFLLTDKESFKNAGIEAKKIGVYTWVSCTALEAAISGRLMGPMVSDAEGGAE